MAKKRLLGPSTSYRLYEGHAELLWDKYKDHPDVENRQDVLRVAVDAHLGELANQPPGVMKRGVSPVDESGYVKTVQGAVEYNLSGIIESAEAVECLTFDFRRWVLNNDHAAAVRKRLLGGKQTFLSIALPGNAAMQDADLAAYTILNSVPLEVVRTAHQEHRFDIIGVPTKEFGRRTIIFLADNFGLISDLSTFNYQHGTVYLDTQVPQSVLPRHKKWMSEYRRRCLENGDRVNDFVERFLNRQNSDAPAPQLNS